MPFTGPVVANSQPTVTCRIDGLANGQNYSLTMAAITEFGVGRASPATEAFTPIQNFSAVTELKAVSDRDTTSLIWGEPMAVEGDFERYEVYVALPGEPFSDEPVSVVDDFTSIGAVVQRSSLPSPYSEQEQQEGEQAQIQSFESGRFQVSNVDPAEDPTLEEPSLEPPTPDPGSDDPMSQVPRYDFKVVTISSSLQSAEVLNTAYISQQLVIAPGAPNTINAELQNEDILIGWTASRFDGGSRILGYQVFVDGECVQAVPVAGSTAPCREFAPDEATFALSDWDYSTTYEISVAALNEIGLSAATVTSITTIEDPTPPVTNYQYPGPILAKFTPSSVATGQVVTVTGLRLNMVERMLIGGKEVEFVIYGADRLALKVPFGLADGLYSVIVFSEFGALTVQDAIRIAGAPVNEDLQDLPALPVAPVVPGTPGDTDGDGIPDNVDADIDGDGIPNGLDPDIDGDGIPNEFDPNPVVPNNPEDALEEPRDEVGAGSDTEEPAVPVSQEIGSMLWLLVLALLLSFGAATGTYLVRKKRPLEAK
jgi:hypothetical protein